MHGHSLVSRLNARCTALAEIKRGGELREQVDGWAAAGIQRGAAKWHHDRHPGLGLSNNKPASVSVQRPASVATWVMGTSPRLDEKLLRFDGDREGMPSFLIIAPRERERVFRLQICIPYFKIGGV